MCVCLYDVCTRLYDASCLNVTPAAGKSQSRDLAEMLMDRGLLCYRQGDMRLAVDDLTHAVGLFVLSAERLGQAYEIRALCFLELATFVVNQELQSNNGKSSSASATTTSVGGKSVMSPSGATAAAASLASLGAADAIGREARALSPQNGLRGASTGTGARPPVLLLAKEAAYWLAMLYAHYALCDINLRRNTHTASASSFQGVLLWLFFSSPSLSFFSFLSFILSVDWSSNSHNSCVHAVCPTAIPSRVTRVA
jgi:hypothetical protein